jgi:hypothetical protein
MPAYGKRMVQNSLPFGAVVEQIDSQLA